ncbi:NAD-dependent epimerase/dehydratase family protein [Oceanospirillaceae bacterium]|nr:NAD-dependent epimerase/dehydratase family protein [Oceanospirillaceae bacterium]
MKKKILIVGGAGFIGMNLAKFLLQNREAELTLADYNFGRDSSEYFTEQEINAISFAQNDFTSPSAFQLLDKDFDFVYMLASVVGVNNTIEHPDEVIRVNTSLIYNCLEWLKTTSVKRVLFSSTSETYAGTTEVLDYPIPTDELVPLCIQDVSDPRFTYAITKILGESAFLNCAKKYDFDATIVRYHNAFGPDMGFKHVIPHLVERFLNNESPFRMYGYDQTRAFSFIADTVEGTVLAMESDKSAGEIFHIGSSQEISIEELIKTVGDMMGYSGEYIEAPTYPGSVSRRCPDISKAKRLLDYNPKIDWKLGLEYTVNWYKDYFSKNSVARQDGFKEQEKYN